jgi:putative flippase GtrA
MSASMTGITPGITVKTGANSCDPNGLREMRRGARDAASRQAAEGERVALHRPDGNSLNAHAFAGGDSSNPCAGNDMQPSAACAANSLSGKLLAANGLRGFGPRTGWEKAAEIGKNLTRFSTLVRWCKFNFVGAVGILVQFGVLFLSKSVLHFNYLAATALAVEVAVVHNFFWHERFTWAERWQWGGDSAGAKARNLRSRLLAALKRCATQKSATQKSASQRCAPGNCDSEARTGPESKAAGKSARSTQTSSTQTDSTQANSTQTRFGRFLRFNLTAGLVSIGGNLGMMRVMVGRTHMHYLVANGIAIAICSLVNFVVSDGWVFRRD